MLLSGSLAHISGAIIALFMDRLLYRRDNCFLRYWESSPIRAYYKDITEILFCGISFSFENISECVLEAVNLI
ncbi:hypothetical protein ANAPC1_01030 [Anaplasma phagocytophilum]|uniref:Uncharacterized protein n=1 Tax=Anaplasma phagocytophilum TaxID=948 RepID=A0AA45ZHY4_ANAPH|nr:hypothetical protein ANAPC1_01030 [Anaplasma phagocytophilum]SBO32374.1 hypothetical protein ANAPC2_01011 [Anaplasma phagocytophilum]SBO32840.1 hypothetical protein ANAPC4_00946 [Anaplasma phagocytophilum]SBO32939.1 hypothetical protein ANAPC3_01046 [Anaplasma phagocytophilum]SCV64459.1 hypothetical protein ANAPC5_00871 [Anaplasma phagocytophilum]